MELKDKKSGTLSGTKALGAAMIANINPSLSHNSPEHATTNLSQSDNTRVFSHSDLVNLTLHQVVYNVIMKKSIAKTWSHICILKGFSVY